MNLKIRILSTMMQTAAVCLLYLCRYKYNSVQKVGTKDIWSFFVMEACVFCLEVNQTLTEVHPSVSIIFCHYMDSTSETPCAVKGHNYIKQ